MRVQALMPLRNVNVRELTREFIPKHFVILVVPEHAANGRRLPSQAEEALEVFDGGLLPTIVSRHKVGPPQTLENIVGGKKHQGGQNY